MSASILLAGLLARGVNLAASDGRLKVDAPRGVVTAEDLAELAACKADVIALLTPPASPPLANPEPTLAEEPAPPAASDAPSVAAAEAAGPPALAQDLAPPIAEPAPPAESSPEESPPLEPFTATALPPTETPEPATPAGVSDPAEPPAGAAAPAAAPWPPRPAELATRPLDRRERWGRRANDLEDAGLEWREAERQAFAELVAETEGDERG